MQANLRFSPPCVLRVAALACLARNDEVRASVQRLFELWPDFTINQVVATNFTSPERLTMLAEALRRAGLPDE